MKRFWIVFRREYSVRVRNKWFIWTTILVPLLLVGFMVVPILAASMTDEELWTVHVQDPTGQTLPHLKDDADDAYRFVPAKQDLAATLQADLADEGPRRAIYATLSDDVTRTQQPVSIYANRTLGLETERDLERRFRQALQNAHWAAMGQDPQAIRQAEIKVSLDANKWTPEGAEATSGVAAMLVAFTLTLLVYVLLVNYGNQVMRGVLEEKTNRIVEVIASSVEPIRFMGGKILGISAVGFTQFGIWVVLIGVMQLVLPLILVATGLMPEPPPGAGADAADPKMLKLVRQALEPITPGVVLAMLFYFIAGFWFYGSLLAALAASADAEADGQQLSSYAFLPLVVPMIFLTPMLQNPNGPLAVTLSMVPLFSPVAMPFRLVAGDVPPLEVALSVLLMLGGVVGIAVLAAKLYRIGILSYGQKPTLKLLWKWLVTK